MNFRYIFLISAFLCQAFSGNSQQFSFSSGSDFRSNTIQVHVSVGQLFGSFQLSNPSFQEGALSILLNATSLDAVASLEKLIHIYPNPTTHFVKIESDIFPWLTSSASIYSIQGILVDTYPIHDPQSQISLSHLPNGAYVLRLSIPGQQDYFHKILKIN